MLCCVSVDYTKCVVTFSLLGHNTLHPQLKGGSRGLFLLIVSVCDQLVPGHRGMELGKMLVSWWPESRERRKEWGENMPFWSCLQ